MKKYCKISCSAVLFLFAVQLHAGIGVGYSAIGSLPVELTSFSVNLNGNSVELHWATATETNNYGFDIERTEVGNKDKQWKTIGFIKGNGNSNSPKEYSFTDGQTQTATVLYRLKQIDNDGKFTYSNVLEFKGNTTPSAFTLGQNFPNPFNPATVISYSIAASSHVAIDVYNMLGTRVTTLVDRYQDAGNYSLHFDAAGLSNGIYYYRIKAGSFVDTKKMLLLK